MVKIEGYPDDDFLMDDEQNLYTMDLQQIGDAEGLYYED